MFVLFIVSLSKFHKPSYFHHPLVQIYVYKQDMDLLEQVQRRATKMTEGWSISAMRTG